MGISGTIKYADQIPYGFILDHLLVDGLSIKPMFGCHGIYVGSKLCLFLIDRRVSVNKHDVEPMENGVYVATTTNHIEQMRADFPDTEVQQLKGDKVWIFIASDHPAFEQRVVRACEMITANDLRIGR